MSAPERIRAAGLSAMVTALLGGPAHAHPGQATHLTGVEPQGPASRAVSALHHNPAMLGAIRGIAVQASGSVGASQLRVRRHVIDPATGLPGQALGEPTSLANPAFGFFTGATFYFEPLALGIGYYDLGSELRLASAESLRYHLAPDPDPDCLDPGLGGCPPLGGSISTWQDLTVALALDRGNFQIGVAAHFPRMRQRFAFDNDTELQFVPASVNTTQCDDKEDPLCAERIGFKGWNHWVPRNGIPGGFNAALTIGVSVQLRRETITLGARYRTFPLQGGGEMRLGGVGLVCRPNLDARRPEFSDDVPPCVTATPVRATLRQRLPQEVALGGSFVLGRNRAWRLDTNLYWMDLCPGGWRPDQCDNRDAQVLSLVGLDRNAAAPPEFRRYRGLQDLYGLEVDAAYRLPARSNIGLLFGGQLSSPSVRREAQTAALGEGWQLGVAAGARIEPRRTRLVLSPGYAVDFALPRRVRPGRAAFDPAAGTAFAESGGDLNVPGGAAVLAGRARPSNAGRYFGMLHMFSLTLAWAEDPVVLQ